MMAWLGAITAAFQFGTLILKLIREKDQCSLSDAAKEMKAMNKDLKEGHEKGDLSAVEDRIKRLRVGKPSS